jgi:hypothetical protein
VLALEVAAPPGGGDRRAIHGAIGRHWLFSVTRRQRPRSLDGRRQDQQCQDEERGIVFATARLSAGVQAVRDMILDAWLASADAPVGYPMVNVRDIESGKIRATRQLFGAD